MPGSYEKPRKTFTAIIIILSLFNTGCPLDSLNGEKLRHRFAETDNMVVISPCQNQ